MNMHHLFPTPVGMFDLDRPLTDEELLFVRGQDTRPNEGNTTSKNNFVLRDPVMTSLRGWIEDCVAEYFKATSNPKHDVHLRITQSWFNYSEQGQWHHKHAHPNSFVSGVFYLNTNFDDKIYFYRSGWQQIRFPPEEWNLYNSESWWFEDTPEMVEKLQGLGLTEYARHLHKMHIYHKNLITLFQCRQLQKLHIQVIGT